MSSPSLTGLSPNNSLKYLGPNVSLVTIVTRNRAPTGADYRQPETGKLYPFGTEWLVGKDPTTGTFGDIWFLTKIVANVAYWERFSDNTQTITGDDGTVLFPVAGNFNIYGQKNGIIPVVDTLGSGNTLSIEDRTSTTAFVVDASSTPGQRGTFSTIQSAITAATSGQTVFIKSGTYTENITLKAGVNLASYGNSGFTPTVNIIGKLSYSQEGAVTISGIGLQTNGDYALSVTGSAASRIFLVECNLVANDFAALQMSSSGVGNSVRIINSWGRTNTNATNFFVVTGVGSLTFWNVNILDATPQTIASTFASTGQLLVKYSIIRFPISTSGTGRISATDSEFNTFQTNTIPLSISSSASGLGNYVRGCILLAGNTTALTVGAAITVNMMGCNVITTSATPIGGTGTLRQCGTSYISSDPIASSTGLTLTRQPFDAGKLWGNWDGSAPSAGYVGESINARVDQSTPVTITTGDVINVTSIILTPGVWDVSGIVMFTGLTTTTRQNASLGTGSAVITLASYGNNTIASTFASTTDEDVGLSIPSFRQLVPVAGGSLTVYLKARATFSISSSPGAYGRISATRVC